MTKRKTKYQGKANLANLTRSLWQRKTPTNIWIAPHSKTSTTCDKSWFHESKGATLTHQIPYICKMGDDDYLKRSDVRIKYEIYM